MRQNKILRVALTGGIGSGKSTVLRIIEELGYNTVSLDAVYSELLSDGDFVMQICKIADIEPIFESGKIVLDKKTLASKMFASKELLEDINRFTHEKIMQAAFARYTCGVVFYEVPLLFEGGHADKFDAVIVVTRDIEARILSAMSRDNCEREQIIRRINNQFDYDNNDLSLHTIIKNDCDKHTLKLRVVKAINEFKEKFKF